MIATPTTTAPTTPHATVVPDRSYWSGRTVAQVECTPFPDDPDRKWNDALIATGRVLGPYKGWETLDAATAAVRVLTSGTDHQAGAIFEHEGRFYARGLNVVAREERYGWSYPPRPFTLEPTAGAAPTNFGALMRSEPELQLVVDGNASLAPAEAHRRG